jgi:ABC-type phosphate transport system substrate-binding protein
VPAVVRAYWARQSFTGMGFRPQADSAEEVSKLVQATPGAIGYIHKKQVAPALKVVLETSP